MNNLLRPGTIVTANYADFEGKKRVGIFLYII